MTAPWFPAPSATHAPAVKATPSAFALSGYVRAYQFDRQNASNDPAGRGQLNQRSINFAIALHFEHVFPKSGWSVGATYVGADPLGANGECSSARSYMAGGSCQQYPKTSSAYREVDTALPAFELSTLSELYVQYRRGGFSVKIGDQSLNLPWAAPSDTRMKAAYYEGVDLQYRFAPGLKLQVARILRWQSRTSSVFNRSTQLTLNADGSFAPTAGFVYAGLSYSRGPSFAATASLYRFYDIANLTWFEARWVLPRMPLEPVMAVQIADEHASGRALAGAVDSTLFGLQLGLHATPNVVITASFDALPVRSRVVTLPAGVACDPTTHTVSGNSGFFLPINGTPNCVPLAGNRATVYYGGFASPYSDGYSTNPIFSSSLTQGMIDRRSSGVTFKLAALVETGDRRWRFVVSRALYNYGNPAGDARTFESDLDATYFFSRNDGEAYRGLQIRERYGERRSTNAAVYGGLPLFKYNRLQLEYDF